MALSPGTEARFIPIIDSILAASDLETISRKRIQKGLQAAVDYDLTPQKRVIKLLIEDRFDNFMTREHPPAHETNGHDPKTNGDLSQDRDASADQESTNSEKAVPKKRPLSEEPNVKPELKGSPAPKKKKIIEYDSDAAFAARLQAEENSRSRSTRGGGPKKPNGIKKKTLKKKTAAKVKAEDDSDMDESGSDMKERKVNRTGGFHKELLLSTPLSALLNNEVKLSRPQTVKRIWEYVRAHDLQDPNDKRMIRCDDDMRAVFKQDKIHMFTMNKILSQNLYSPDE